MKKIDSPDHSEKKTCFWFCAGLLAILVASTLSRDITRPFYGLHSWDHAHYAWMARNHVKYGLGYTKGLDTFAVGNPPAKNPQRYLNHPQLNTLLYGTAMAIFGINNWSVRLANLLTTIATLFLFLKILRRLVDDITALLAGLLFCLFPLIGYFGAYGMWLYPLSFLAIWCYLVLIESLKDGPQPKKYHKWVLAISLFLALQLAWEGFFWALAIGVHYIFRCIHRRQLPDKTLLTILVIAPLSSLMFNFAIMAAGHGWDFQRIVELYKWRAGSGEMREHVWSAWFAKLWEHAITNFTLPILITAIVYLTLGQVFVFATSASGKKEVKFSRRFPQFWLFLMPAVFQLLLIKGALWQHQTWERPFVPFIAIAAALGVMVLTDILKRTRQWLAVAGAVVLVGIFFIYCEIGTNYYYAVRWQAPEKVRMFEMLKQNIPPDKALLSFEDFVVDQKHGVKAASYRPEIAWYLDRDIEVAQSLKDIEQKAKSGRFPYYLMPETYSDKRVAAHLANLSRELRQRYRIITYIPYVPGERTKDGKFLRAGMMPYMIFDLQSKLSSK